MRTSPAILIPVADPRSGGPLLRLVAMITGTSQGRPVYALNLRRPVDRDAYRSGLDDDASPSSAGADPLHPLLAQAERDGVRVEAIAFVSRQPADDIVRVARERQVDLVLMGFHRPVFGRTILGGTVHRVLERAEADVAVFVDRGFQPGARRVLVPYLGGRHDRLALALAGRLARHGGMSVTILHVVAKTANRDGPSADARGAMERAFPELGAEVTASVHLSVVADASPVEALLRAAKDADLIVIGVEERWGLESHMFGWRSERIAAECPVSLLIVRAHGEMERWSEAGPQAAAPTETVTTNV